MAGAPRGWPPGNIVAIDSQETAEHGGAPLLQSGGTSTGLRPPVGGLLLTPRMQSTVHAPRDLRQSDRLVIPEGAQRAVPAQAGIGLLRGGQGRWREAMSHRGKGGLGRAVTSLLFGGLIFLLRAPAPERSKVDLLEPAGGGEGAQVVPISVLLRDWTAARALNPGLRFRASQATPAALPLSYRSSAGLRVTLGVGRRRASLQVMLAVLELTLRVPAFTAVKTLHT